MKTAFWKIAFIVCSANICLHLSCRTTSTSTKDLPGKAGSMESGLPKEMEIWKRAVIHIECTTDIETVQQRIHSSKESLHEYHEERHSGTAVFIKHQNRRYLVTPRHIVHDTLQAKQHLSKAVDGLSDTWSQEFRKTYLQSARQRANNCIFNVIYTVPSLREYSDKTAQMTPEFLLGLGTGSDTPLSYTFSDSVFNLAVISLDPLYSRFADRLVSSGYVPISSDAIIDQPSSENADIIIVDFPLMPALFHQLDVEMAEKAWETGLISIPTFTFGRVISMDEQQPTFICDVNLFSGNRGGPVIEGETIIGIINTIPRTEINDVVSIEVLKGKHIKTLLNVQAEKDNLLGE
jgi:hypothetical protein